jgi:hypothetical protein
MVYCKQMFRTSVIIRVLSLDPFAVIYKSLSRLFCTSLYFYLSPGFLIVSMIYYFQNKTLFLFPSASLRSGERRSGFWRFFIQLINFFFVYEAMGTHVTNVARKKQKTFILTRNLPATNQSLTSYQRLNSKPQSYLKKIPVRTGTWRQVFICPRSPPLLGFCLGW